MRRRHLVEIEDLDWCPQTLRDGATDFLRFALTTAKPYSVVAPLLADALRRCRAEQILDLCSGGAGPWFDLYPILASHGFNLPVTLTDKYPSGSGGGTLQTSVPNPAITYCPESVDAMRIPANLPGFRTMFTAFHHFRPGEGRTILADAVVNRRGIAVFEVTRRTPGALLLVPLIPLAVLAVTPWIRPFRWSRLLWTYLIPLVPVLTLWDGLVSCFRSYTPEELKAMTADLGGADYCWDAGSLRTGTPARVTYLIGVPT